MDCSVSDCFQAFEKRTREEKRFSFISSSSISQQSIAINRSIRRVKRERGRERERKMHKREKQTKFMIKSFSSTVSNQSRRLILSARCVLSNCAYPNRPLSSLCLNSVERSSGERERGKQEEGMFNNDRRQKIVVDTQTNQSERRA